MLYYFVLKSMGVLNGNIDLKVDYFEVWKFV